MEWIGCVRCEKSRRDFVARTFALIAPVDPMFAPSFMQLRNDTKCTQTLCNARNMSLGSNGVDWGRSLRKITTWLRGTNYCINCTSSPCFATSFIQLWNDPKCTQTLCNAPKFEFTVQWGGLGAFVAKNPYVTSWHEFCINCTSSPRSVPSFMQLWNVNKCTQTLYNTIKHEFRSNGVDWMRSLRKIRTWLRGTNFCINCTNSHRFALSFM